MNRLKQAHLSLCLNTTGENDSDEVLTFEGYQGFGVKRRILADAARIFGVHPSTVCRLLAASAPGSHENDTRVPNIAERIWPNNFESIISRWSLHELDLFVLLSSNRIK
jgi:hypothetical protein